MLQLDFPFSTLPSVRVSRERTIYLITGEYPPDAGGVADYTRLVARALAEAGRDAHVLAGGDGESVREEGVTVHRVAGRFAGAGLRRATRVLESRPAPRHVIVQWVPHAYGWRAMNVALCWWVYRRAARHGDQVDVMVHEAALAFSGTWKQRLAAVVHRLMLVLLLRAARQVFVSTPEWAARCRPFALGRRVPFRWAPVPSNVARVASNDAIRLVRDRVAPGGERIAAHFGTYGALVSATLLPTMARILESDPSCRVLLLGAGSDRARELLAAGDGAWAGRIHATGQLAPADLSAHLGAADVFVQPFPDGVSARRGSAMAILAHGRAMVTTRGKGTEAPWLDGGAVLVPVGDVDALAAAAVSLLHDDAARACVATAGEQLYASRFDVRHTVDALLRDAA